MNPGDIRKLLGGYAAGVLTEEERRALFEAALTDQDLFNELAREQALKELLEEPAARRQLLEALREKPGLLDRFRAWLSRPVAWVAVGSLAVATLLVVVVVRRTEAPSAIKPVLTARLESQPTPEPSRIAPRAVAPATAKPKEPAEPPAPAVVLEETDQRADEAKSEPPLAVKDQAVGALVSADAAPPPAASPVRAAQQTVSVEPVAVPAEVRGLDIQPVGAADRSAIGRTNLMKSALAEGPAGGALDKASLVGASPYSYRIQRAGADGSFADAAPRTVFRSDERVRVVLTSSEPGHLRLTALVAGRSRALLDTDMAKGATVNLDVPADVRELQGTFAWAGTQPRPAGARGTAAPPPIEEIITIPIPREPAR
jgi:hypothetical protein